MLMALVQSTQWLTGNMSMDPVSGNYNISKARASHIIKFLAE